MNNAKKTPGIVMLFCLLLRSNPVTKNNWIHIIIQIILAVISVTIVLTLFEI